MQSDHFCLAVFPAFANAEQIVFMIFTLPLTIETGARFGEPEPAVCDQLLVVIIPPFKSSSESLKFGRFLKKRKGS